MQMQEMLGEAPEAEAEGEAATATSGYCVKITVMPDGSITVGVDPYDEMDGIQASDPAIADPEEMDSQPVASIREAVQVLLDIYKNAGAMAGAPNEEMDAAKEAYKNA